RRSSAPAAPAGRSRDRAPWAPTNADAVPAPQPWHRAAARSAETPAPPARGCGPARCRRAGAASSRRHADAVLGVLVLRGAVVDAVVVAGIGHADMRGDGEAGRLVEGTGHDR